MSTKPDPPLQSTHTEDEHTILSSSTSPTVNYGAIKAQDGQHRDLHQSDGVTPETQQDDSSSQPTTQPVSHSQDAMTDNSVRALLPNLAIPNTIVERVRFVAEGALLKKLTDENLQDIYNLFLNDDNAGKAATLLYKCIESSIPSTDSNTLNKLSDLGKLSNPDHLGDKQEVVSRIGYYQQLLDFSDKFQDESQAMSVDSKGTRFERFVCQFDERKELAGKAHVDIHTPIQLFKCLLHKKVLPQDSPDKWIEILENKLPSEPVLLIQESGGSHTSDEAKVQNPNPKCTKKSPEHEEDSISDSDGSQSPIIMPNSSSQRKRRCSKMCAKWTVCASGFLALGLLVVLPPLVTFNVMIGMYSTQPFSKEFPLIRNVTVLLAKVNNQYFETVQFNLSEFHYSPNVTICAIDCTQSDPEVFVNIFQYVSISTTRQHRRRVIFEDDDLPNLIYMTENSSLVFAVENVQLPLEVHMFTSELNCSNFQGGSEIPSLRTLTLESSNNHSATFTVPLGSSPGYYCAVWVINSNITFSYHIEASIRLYQLAGTCKSAILDTLIPYTYNLSLTLSTLEKYTCVLLSQSEPDASVRTANIQFFTTFGPVFKILTPFSASLFLLFIICVLIFIILTLCWYRCKESYAFLSTINFCYQH